MKILSGRLVCDYCEGPFEMGHKVIQEWTVDGVLTSFIDSDDRGLNISYISRLRKPGTAKFSKHAECCNVIARAGAAESNRIDSLKAELAALDSSQQQSIYKFLHDACGRRLF